MLNAYSDSSSYSSSCFALHCFFFYLKGIFFWFCFFLLGLFFEKIDRLSELIYRNTKELAFLQYYIENLIQRLLLRSEQGFQLLRMLMYIPYFFFPHQSQRKKSNQRHKYYTLFRSNIFFVFISFNSNTYILHTYCFGSHLCMYVNYENKHLKQKKKQVLSHRRLVCSFCRKSHYL